MNGPIEKVIIYKAIIIHLLSTGMFGYYGIPNEMNKNGYYPTTNKFDTPEPCKVGADDECVPYEKTFFLHYQWFPFYVAVLGLLFYLPYVVFRANNGELLLSDGKGISIIMARSLRFYSIAFPLRIDNFLDIQNTLVHWCSIF